MKKSNAIKMLAAGAALSIGLAFSAGAGMTAFAAEPTAEEFYSAGAAIRVIETGSYENGIRFDMLMSKEYYEANNIAEAKTGVLVVPERLIVGAELDLADDVKGSEQGGLAADKDLTGMWYAEDGEDLYRNHAYLYNLPDTVYDDDIAFRGYITVDGVTTYTETVVRSMSQVALAAITEDPSLEESIGGYLYNYDVTFSGAEVAAQTVRYGSAATEPETDPVKARNHFTGWFTSAELTEEYDFAAPVYGDTVIYAGFEPHSYTEGVCSCGETLNDNAIISDDVTYDETTDSWTVNGSVAASYFEWGNVTFTITKEKLEAMQAEGFTAIDMVVDDKEEQIMSKMVYRDSASGTHLGTSASGASITIQLDNSADTLSDITIYISYRNDIYDVAGDGVLITFAGAKLFDEADFTTWWTSDNAEITATDTGVKISTSEIRDDGVAQPVATLKPEAVQYLIDEGWSALHVNVLNVVPTNNVETYFNTWSSGGNLYTATPDGAFVVEDMTGYADSGMTLWFVIYKCVDIGEITVTLQDLPFDENDMTTWFYGEQGTTKFTESADGVGIDIYYKDVAYDASVTGNHDTIFRFYLRKAAVDYLLAQGNKGLEFTVFSYDTDFSLIGMYLDNYNGSAIVAAGSGGGALGTTRGTGSIEDISSAVGSNGAIRLCGWFRRNGGTCHGISIEKIEGITENTEAAS